MEAEGPSESLGIEEFKESRQIKKKESLFELFGKAAEEVINVALDQDQEEDKDLVTEQQPVEELKTKEKVFLKKFVVFKCGHSFHERCLIAQQSKANFKQ